MKANQYLVIKTCAIRGRGLIHIYNLFLNLEASSYNRLKRCYIFKQYIIFVNSAIGRLSVAALHRWRFSLMLS